MRADRSQRIARMVLLAGLAVLSGCATVEQDAGFDAVAGSVEQRIGKDVVWSRGTELDKEAQKAVQKLLGDELTADEAVQVALLNNRELQATYSQLGVAQADLVEAGLLKNPVFEAVATLPASGGQADWELGVAMDFLQILYLPLRKRVARSEFEAAKLRATGAVLGLAGRTRAAFYRHQANRQRLEMRRKIVESTQASLTAARKLHEAGNIPDLDLERERGLAQEAKLDLRSAEVAVRESRERLNTLMGVWGEATQWEVAERLPEIPDDPMRLKRLEERAIEQSLDLAAARQEIISAGEALGLEKASSLVPEAEAGGIAEREEGSWEAGPALALPLPIFDQGQGRVGRARARLRRAQQAYYARAVRIRSAARSTRDRLRAARDRALYYRDVQLPMRDRVVRETQLQYNAMQLGVFELLRAREQQIATGERYIRALERYWVTRAELEQLLSGHLAELNAGTATPMNEAGGGGGMRNAEGGH